MRRYLPLALVGIGIVVIVLAVIKVLPGAGGMGGGLCFVGLLLFGLGFIKYPEVGPDSPPPVSPVEQTLGMFYQPAEVFRNFKFHPRWLAAVLLISISVFIYNAAFTARITPERIADHMVEGMQNSGFNMKQEQLDAMREQTITAAKSPIGKTASAVNTVVIVIVFNSFLALIYWVGVLAFGGKMNYWSAVAVATHAALPVVLLQKLLSLGILFLKAPEDLHPVLNAQTMIQDNLGVLFSPAQNPVLFVVGSAIGVLSFYGVWLTATGIKNGAEKAPSSAGWTIAIGISVIGLMLGVILAMLFPGFMK